MARKDRMQRNQRTTAPAWWGAAIQAYTRWCFERAGRLPELPAAGGRAKFSIRRETVSGQLDAKKIPNVRISA